jgi:uncharacterized protein (DUF2147 family)
MKIKSKISQLFVIAVATLFSIGSFNNASAQQKTDNSSILLGKWINDENDRTIEFVKKDKLYSALILTANDKSLIGKEQIINLKWNGKSFTSGKLIIIKKGKTFDCTVTIKDNNTIEITGKSGFMNKSQTWKRVK